MLELISWSGSTLPPACRPRVGDLYFRMMNPANLDFLLVGAVLALLGGACKSGSVDSLHATGPTEPTSAIVTNPPATDTGHKCPRPTDKYGPLYYEVTGLFAGISVDPGGGKFVVLKRSAAAMEEQFRATDELIDQLSSVGTGTAITLVSYRVSSRAGSQPPFSCFELA
jgi:hypothetical protein